MSRATKTKVPKKKKAEPVRAGRSVRDAAAPRDVRLGNPWWQSDWVLGAALVLMTILAYLPVWHAGFVWDDDAMLTDNPLLSNWSGLLRLWYTTSTPDYYPVTSCMLLLERKIWGLNPLGFHLVNVLLHAGSAVLWWRIFLRVQIPGAWLAAAIFALHPVNVESVAWIAERKNTLSMLLYGGALLCYLKFEDTKIGRWYGISLAVFALALLSKTAGSPLPVVLLLLAWWRRGRIEREDVRRAIPFFIVAAVAAAITIWFQSHRAIGHAVVRTDGFWSRLAASGCAIWYYLYKAILPVNLVFVYPRWPVDSRNFWWFVPLLLVAAASVWFWRRRKTWGRPWLFALAYFVALLLPTLGFINVYFMRYSLVADHWQYFAIIAPIGLIATGIWNHVGAARSFVGGLVLAVLGVLTWYQTQMYTDLETLWRTTAEKNPGSTLANNSYGEILSAEGRTAEAIMHFEAALEADPDNAEAHNNLGVALVSEGRNSEGIEEYRKALALTPDYAEFYSNLGTAFVNAGRLNEAIEQYHKAISIGRDSAEYHRNLGNALIKAGRKNEAAAEFKAAIELKPDYAIEHNKLGLDAAHRGQMDAAESHFQMAIQLAPNFAEAHINYGNTLIEKKNLADAATEYRKALELDPNNAEAQNNLALILATASDASLRNGPEAVRLAERAVQSQGEKSRYFLPTLAAAYAEAGNFTQAVETAQRALNIAETQHNSGAIQTLEARLKLFRDGKAYHGMGAAQ